MTIPTNNTNRRVAFPKNAPRRLRLDQAWVVYPDGSIRIDPWLVNQVRKYVPESKSLAGEEFKEVCMAWFRWAQAKIIKRKHLMRRKGRNRGLVDSVSRTGKPIKRMQDHVQGGYYHAQPKYPVGLVSIDEPLELALAYAGFRLRTA